MHLVPTFRYEEPLWRQGYRFIAGLDEVGRGALAGPVAAAAVILPPRARFPWLKHVRDSKLLSPANREELAARIESDALAVGVGFISHATVDAIGIVRATRLAMLQALLQLPQEPDYLLIDALLLAQQDLPQQGIIDGDALSKSIACASIVAKVARDALMRREGGRFRGYGFAANKGYATAFHREALWRLGPCFIHRRSFAPVRSAVFAFGGRRRVGKSGCRLR